MSIKVTSGAKWCKTENNFGKATLRLKLGGDKRKTRVELTVSASFLYLLVSSSFLFLRTFSFIPYETLISL